MALTGKASVKHLCIREFPRSGKPDELMDKYGISARHIVAAVKQFLA
jgi:transketolase